MFTGIYKSGYIPLLLLAISINAEAHGSNRCFGMHFEDIDRMCVKTRKPCGGFAAGATNLSVVAGNLAERMCVVANLTDPERGFEVCNSSHLIPTQPHDCISAHTMAKAGEFGLALFGFLLVEAVLTVRACRSHTKATWGLLYWFNDFWAGLLAWELATLTCTGMKNEWTQMLWGFLGAMLFESLIYDLPMTVTKQCCGCGAACFVWLSPILGVLYGSAALMGAYRVSYIVVMGHHVVLMGLIQFAIDFGKGALKGLVWQKLSGSGATTPYEPLITELTSPLPFDP